MNTSKIPGDKASSRPKSNSQVESYPEMTVLPKIIIIQGAFLPIPAVAGGAVEKLWHRLGHELANIGHQVTHISKKHPGQASQEVNNGVNYRRVRGFNRPKNVFANYLYDLIYSWNAIKCASDADVIVTNSFFSPILARIFYKSKIYISVHRFPRNQYWLYGSADRFQCVSSSVAEELISQTPSAINKTKVIPNFVGQPITKSIAPNPTAKRRILYVGRIHPEKGLMLLISAFGALSTNMLTAWELHIVGPSDIAGGGGGKKYLDELTHLATNSVGTVIFHPPTYAEEKLDSYYSQADLFVYPSIARKGEAFGLAPLEAMAHGVPVIVSNLACFEDFVTEGMNGWIFDAFSPNSKDLLAKTIERGICALQQSKEKLSTSAKSTAISFSAERVAQMLSTDFIELCQK